MHATIREKNLECLLCMHATIREHFDIRMIRSFCPGRFDQFAFSPYVGASGGILIIWKFSVSVWLFHLSLVITRRSGLWFRSMDHVRANLEMILLAGCTT